MMPGAKRKLSRTHAHAHGQERGTHAAHIAKLAAQRNLRSHAAHAQEVLKAAEKQAGLTAADLFTEHGISSQKMLLQLGTQFLKTQAVSASPLLKTLGQDFFKSVFPIGGSVLELGYSLYNSDIMNEKQRAALCGALSKIGGDLVTAPIQVLSGEISLEKACSKVENSMKKLGDFFIDNPEVAIRAGTTILQRILPLGSFLPKAIEALMCSKEAKPLRDGLVSAFGSMVKQMVSLEGSLEQAVAPRQAIR